MKKILTVVLVLACVCALASCVFDSDPAVAFASAIANTDPEKATINTVTGTELGELKGEYVITYGDEGAASIKYSYEQWNKVGEGDEPKRTVTGTITRQADGTYTDGKGFSAKADEVTAGFTLNIAGVMDEAEINDAGDTLTVTVASADTEAVLGVKLAYDAELTVIIGGGVVESISVTFADGSNTGSITCKYK